jgi:hypothetical protein
MVLLAGLRAFAPTVGVKEKCTPFAGDRDQCPLSGDACVSADESWGGGRMMGWDCYCVCVGDGGVGFFCVNNSPTATLQRKSPFRIPFLGIARPFMCL